MILADIKVKRVCIDLVSFTVYIVLVFIIAAREPSHQPAAEAMPPLQRNIPVAITIGGITGKIKPVVTEITRKKQVIFRIEPVTDTQVAVIERGLRPVVWVGQ